MAQRKQDFLGNVIGRITELPGAKGLIDSVQSLGERLDDMQKRVRGLEKMEKRLADLERRVKTLEGGRAASTTARTRSTAPRKAPSTKASGASTTRRSSTPKKPPPT
jgi:TolA-binding protein